MVILIDEYDKPILDALYTEYNEYAKIVGWTNDWLLFQTDKRPRFVNRGKDSSPCEAVHWTERSEGSGWALAKGE